MSGLTSKQLKKYKRDGYVFPIDVLSKKEANEIKKEIEKIEKKWPNILEGLGRNYVHLISPVFDKVCHNSKVLDANPDFDMQTFDNLFQAITMAKETYLK